MAESVKFEVRRTSDHLTFDPGHPPCEAATRGSQADYDRRTFRSPAEYDAKFGGRGKNWIDKGAEHGNYDGGIYRRLEDEPCWILRLATLDEFLAFVEQHGEVVVSPGFKNELPLLEIYDDYRE
jgi:hypothetical protein